MEWFNAFLENWVLDAAQHWLVSSCLGFAAFWLTLTIFSAPLYTMSSLRRLPTSRAVIYGILACSLLLGISLALASHAWLDGFVSWWSTPLGPPLGGFSG